MEKMITPFSQFMSGFASSHFGAAMLKDSDFARALLIKTMPETDAQLRFVAVGRHRPQRRTGEDAWCIASAGCEVGSCCLMETELVLRSGNEGKQSQKE